MEVKDILLEIIKISKSMNITTYLFGSFCYGKPHNSSDIDIAIEADNIHEYYEYMDKLEEIETIRQIDLIDLNDKFIGNNFKEEIYNNGRILYKKIWKFW